MKRRVKRETLQMLLTKLLKLIRVIESKKARNEILAIDWQRFSEIEFKLEEQSLIHDTSSWESAFFIDVIYRLLILIVAEVDDGEHARRTQ